jgi:hypothetical protein
MVCLIVTGRSGGCPVTAASADGSCTVTPAAT